MSIDAPSDRVPRIGLDVTSVVEPRPSGVARYIRGLVERLSERDDLRPVLYCRSSRWRLGDPRDAFEGTPVVRWYDGLLAPRVDLFHAPDLRPPRRAVTPLVVTIHDLSALDREDHASPRFLARKRSQLERVVRRAARIITHTEQIRAELITRLGLAPERIVSVPLWPALPGAEDAPITDAPLLVVGGPSRRKRSETIASLLAALDRSGFPHRDVAWCGSATEPIAEAFFSSLDSATRERIRWLGHIDDAELDRRMRGARALLQLSDTEGFGIPLVEAARRRCPLLVRRSPTAEEVLSREGAFWFGDADEGEQLAAFLKESERTRRTEIAHQRAEALSLERTVEETVAVYRQAGALRPLGATSAAG